MKKYIEKHVNGNIKCKTEVTKEHVTITYWDMDGNFESFCCMKLGSNKRCIKKWINLNEIWVSVFEDDLFVDEPFMVGLCSRK